MSRKITILFLISVFFTVQSVFAQYDLPEPELKIPAFNSLAYFASDVDNEADYEVPYSIRNNEYYLESLRLAKLAQDTYEYGDYDASTGFAEEAIRFAQLSDEYVAAQLKLRGVAAANNNDKGKSSSLPKQYTVRPWASTKDCFWNIAGYSWVYGDPKKWKSLYEANKSKLADPNNPNVIEPGVVLDIPSINNEERQGMWRP